MSRNLPVLRRRQVPAPRRWARHAPTAALGGGLLAGLLVALVAFNFGPALMRYVRIKQM